MLLTTIICDCNNYESLDEINNIREYFNEKNIIMGIVESVKDDTHFIKIFCEDENCTDQTINIFNLYVASIIYKVIIDEFNKKYMDNFLNDIYFFLKDDEIYEIKKLSKDVLLGEKSIVDEKDIYCINRRNSIIQKIVECMEENKEININGFLTFRMKEICNDIESIIDKVIEKYMVDKEYKEFIKLLKYFVEIQESKINEVNIIVKNNGSYLVKDENDFDIMEELTSDLFDARYIGTVSMEDMIISGLITNAPKKIVIHCIENCKNKEFMETIQNVFLDRVIICDDCKFCNKIRSSLKN